MVYNPGFTKLPECENIIYIIDSVVDTVSTDQNTSYGLTQAAKDDSLIPVLQEMQSDLLSCKVAVRWTDNGLDVDKDQGSTV